ncbi:WD repeat protein [Perilla frutescens var. frutescens]|nr:WD repeat protein [Perilla frutescens var. frutescens]
MATVSTYHGGVFGPRLSSPSHPFVFSRQSYDRELNWKPLHERVEVPKTCRLSARVNAKAKSELNVEPSGTYETEGDYYLDELDVVSFLDPPKDLIPFDPSSYNPASYLWKKIEDIPEERRHHLIYLLDPRLISRAWEVAGRRYDDDKLAKKSASSLLYDGNCAGSLELWKCRTSGAPLPVAWMDLSQKAIFCCTDGKAYGRLIGRNPLSGIVNSFFPLYFSVRQINEVMSTEQPCDFTYEFGDGMLDLPEYPQEYPKPAKHPWPFNDQVVIYIRHVGPGVMVGQAWQEGRALQQVPKKLCSEILMVKDYFAFSKKN